MSFFRIIFPSDNSAVEVDEFLILLFSSLSKQSRLMLPLVFRRILPLKGLLIGNLLGLIFQDEA